jgi:hypothetical protein
MNPFRFTVECHVCGGEGAGDINASAAQFYGFVSHSDPRVCAEVLAGKKAAMERKEKELAERERALKV